MATQFVPVYYPNTIAESAKYFSKKEALSKESAIELRPVDWAAMGFTNYPIHKIIKRFPFIKETNGKYWFDQEELEIYQLRQRRMLNWVIAFSILLIASAVALPLLLS